MFERLLARLLSVAPDRWALKGALALDFRSPERARATKDADLVGPDSAEQATEDLLAAQAVDLNDHFVFRLTRTREAVSEHPEPTVRFHVTAELAGAVFDECTIDVGLGGSGEWDMEHVTSNLLGFADVEPVIIPVIPVEVHVAEKVHAYTRLYGRGQRSSTRAKDLVDLVVFVTTTELDAIELRDALDRVFARRATHERPASLPAPPRGWSVAYRALAAQVRIDLDLSKGHGEVSACLNPVLSGQVKAGIWNLPARVWTQT